MAWRCKAALGLFVLIAFMYGCSAEVRPDDKKAVVNRLVSVQGRVLDENKKPVRGAVVTLTVGIFSRACDQEALTDTKGRFVFRRVPWPLSDRGGGSTAGSSEQVDFSSTVFLHVTKEIVPDTLYKDTYIVSTSGTQVTWTMEPKSRTVSGDALLSSPRKLERFEEHWPNGKPKAKGARFVVDASANSYAGHGEHCTWYEGGQLKSVTVYVFGRETGTRIEYWPNGNPKIKESYDKAGHPAGLCLYHENGKMAVRGTFKWNAGTHKEFRLFGHPHDTGKDFEYRDYHGIWTYWNVEGGVIAQGEWRDGQPWSGTCRVRVIGPKYGPAALGMVADSYEFRRYKSGKVVQGSAVESSRAEGE